MQRDRDIPSETVQGFLSYSRDDNVAMNNIADEIKSRIEGLYRAKTGRRIQIFVDRHDIGWGEDWRERIAESVRSATAFIPLVTMNYFNRLACREELMAFYNSARILGVTDLLLPIVLAGSRSISDSDPREEVRVIERLQSESLENVWPRGFASPEWLTAINTITDKLIVALDRAENRIAEIEREQGGGEVESSTIPGSPSPSTAEGVVSDEDDGGDSGLYYLMHEFNEECERFGEVAPRLTEDFKDFAEALGRALENLNSAPDRRAISQRSIVAANEIAGPSTRLGESGTEFLAHLSAADAALRQIIAEFESFNTPTIHERLRQTLAMMQGIFTDAEEVPAQLDETVEMLKLVQRMSVSLRRAVAPGYKGFSAVRDAAHILKSWEDLANN